MDRHSPDAPVGSDGRFPSSSGGIPLRALLLLHGLFLVSGALALVYEVLWMRRFAVLFGATAPATAATLAAVFLGWGLGSLVFGARCARWKRPLRAFGWIEIGVGAGALLVEPILSATQGPLSSLPGSFGGSSWSSLAADTVTAIAAVLPATLLMGGSLPVLGEAIAGHRGRLGVSAGGLYAINTLGAAAGAIAVPLVLLPSFGASRAVLAAAACSAAVGMSAWLLDASLARSGRVSRGEGEARSLAAPRGAAAATAPDAPATAGLLLLAFLSGLLTLAFESLAAGTLAQVHENSIHAFAAVLAVFLVGLAAGASAARTLLRRGASERLLLGVSWAGAGAALLAAPRLFDALTGGLGYVEGGAGHGGWRLAGIAIASLGPATLLCGAVLPVLMEWAGGAGGRHAGPALGGLLGANTAGAIAGPLVATFLLRPAVGLWWSLTLAGAAMIAVGAVVLRRRGGARWPGLAIVAALLVALLALRPGEVPRLRLEAGERLVSIADGAFGTVAVVERDGSRRMKLDNSYLIGGTASTGDERLQAHVPLLLHPAPRRVAFLGMGSGISAGGALLHPVEEVTLVEIVPEVIGAARDHFGAANLGVVTDPRVRVTAADARHWLATAGAEFDVIVGDLLVPWRAAESALFTREHVEAARRALAPGGLYCQWVPLYQMSEAEFRIVVRTFLDVFPAATLWHGDLRAAQPAVGLVGRAGGAPIDPAIADDRARALARRGDPANPYLAAPAGLWLHLIGAIGRDDPWLSGARINRDDRPWIELSGAPPAGRIGAAGAALTGRAATTLLDRLGRDASRPAMDALLGAERLRWRAAGRRLWEASLLAAEGRDAEADATGLAALASLPPEIQRAATGRVLCESGCPDPIAEP